VAGRHRRGDQRDRPGRYEVRPGPAGLKVIVWVEPGKPPLTMTTIAAGRLPLLAEALNEHLAGNP
jgi:hypothetical protein